MHHRPDEQPRAAGEDLRLYLVYVEARDPGAILGDFDARQLADGVFLVATALSRSRLYHAIKHRLTPSRLLVAPLRDDPKFKGMAPGALKWLRKLRMQGLR